MFKTALVVALKTVNNLSEALNTRWKALSFLNDLT